MSGPAAWGVFAVIVVVLLALDLGVFHRHGKEPSLRSAIGWSVFWVAVSLTFNAWVWINFGAQAGQEFLAGYLLEKALSVDNLFVISVIFTYLSIPRVYQHRVLFWGILAAVATRGLAIGVGVEVLHQFEWMSYVLGAFLVYTGVKLLGPGESEEEGYDNPMVRLAKRLVNFTDKLDGENFFVKVDGRWAATPLLLALVIVESTDVVFAIDSIPAVLGVTRDPFIVYTSNVFAILGLRAMYFVLADAVVRFYFMKHGLAAILSFVGLKMLVAPFYHVPTNISLALIMTILFLAGVASWLRHQVLERQRTAWQRSHLRTHEGAPLRDLAPGDSGWGPAEMVKALHGVPLFASTVLDDLREVAYDLYVQRFAAGEQVFDEGDEADALYVVLSGQVSVLQRRDGAHVHLATLGPSEAFGEVALFDDLQRTAAVIADEDTVVMALARDAFHRLGDRRPAVLREVIRVLSARLRLANDALSREMGAPETADLPLLRGGTSLKA